LKPVCGAKLLGTITACLGDGIALLKKETGIVVGLKKLGNTNSVVG